MRKITCVFAMLVMYACGMFAATDFTALPELTTDETNPIVYAIVNYRGDCYSVKGDSLMSALKADGFSNPSVMTSEIDRSSLWYFTEGDNSSVYIHSLEYSGGVATGLKATLKELDKCRPYYLLANDYSNGKGLVISTARRVSANSTCLDASDKSPELSEGWHPMAGDWQGTCWFFVKIDDPDNLTAAQKACDEAFAENHGGFVYQGLKFKVNDDSKTCTLTGSANLLNKTLTIPETAIYNGVSYPVTAIAGRAFYRRSDLTGDLLIPNSIVSIGFMAFDGCSGFDGRLKLPAGLTVINERTFADCSNFTGSLIIPDGVEIIGQEAFMNCSGFTGDLVIPESVTEIKVLAFYDCSGFDGTLTLGNSLKTIDRYAFERCTGFTGDLVIPESVTQINISAFQECSGFTGNLILGKSVTSIGYDAFRNCTGFTGELVISASVTEIGDFTFSNCPDFASKSCLAVVPPTLGREVFDEGSVIYVPAQSLDIYKLNDRWSEYMLLPVDKKPVLSQTSAVLNIGETLQLTATISGNDAEVVWSSLNAEIASVSNTGLVTAIGAGKTAVLATTPDGFRTHCNITVIDPTGIDTVSDNNQIKVTGRSIEAPAGSRVIDLSGTEVGASNLAPGTYIVILPSTRPLKVVIR